MILTTFPQQTYCIELKGHAEPVILEPLRYELKNDGTEKTSYLEFQHHLSIYAYAFISNQAIGHGSLNKVAPEFEKLIDLYTPGNFETQRIYEAARQLSITLNKEIHL